MIHQERKLASSLPVPQHPDLAALHDNTYILKIDVLHVTSLGRQDKSSVPDRCEPSSFSLYMWTRCFDVQFGYNPEQYQVGENLYTALCIHRLYSYSVTKEVETSLVILTGHAMWITSWTFISLAVSLHVELSTSWSMKAPEGFLRSNGGGERVRETLTAPSTESLEPCIRYKQGGLSAWSGHLINISTRNVQWDSQKQGPSIL